MQQQRNLSGNLTNNLLQISENNVEAFHFPIQVLVKTDDIITNEEQLFRNRRTAVWMEGEEYDITLTKTAPPDTFLNRLYRLKNTWPITVAKRYNAQNYEPILRRSFWFNDRVNGNFIINIISSFYPYLKVENLYWRSHKILRQRIERELNRVSSVFR